MLTTQQRHFDQLFTDDGDPWGYTSRWYERRRFSLLLALLDRPHYERVFEPACANGTFTAMLAPRADCVVAWDGSARATDLARLAVAGMPHVSVDNRIVPGDWPEGTFDLIVLSDFCYYLDEKGIVRVAEQAATSLRPGGTIVAGHWLGNAADFRVPGGGAVQEILERTLGPVSGPLYIDDEQVLAGWLT